MSDSYSNINNYIFKKDIGEGTFGKVKLGIFNPTGEEFAIKILNKEKIKITMKNSIFKENQIITRFNHINVIYVYRILEDDKNFYIIMEYCKYGELFDYIIKKGNLSEEESSILFYQLINGLEHIHSKGIAHRDLKPENLLLADNNILKIIDFGLGHEFLGEGDELLKTKCGSPSYAAPEIICCSSYDGFKIDVWCCGIILYAMICGYLPFEGDDNEILFKNIIECKPEMPDFMSKTSIDIIMKILNPNPDKRITIDEIKNHEFYLKGKKLSNIDYNKIENNIIKKRKNFIKLIDGKDKNINDINNDNYNKIILELNNKNNNKTKVNNKNIINKVKNSNSLKAFKDKIIDINLKYTKTIDAISNKIQQILKNDYNKKAYTSSRPKSTKKNSKKINKNNNNNILTTSHNNINKNNINKKGIHIDLSSDNRNNKKINKDSLFININSTKNNFLNLKKDYEKLDSLKYNTNINLNKIDEKKTPKRKNKSKDNISTDKRSKSNKIKTLENQLTSLSNEHLNSNSNKKKHQKFNLFKEAIKNKNKRKNRFNIKKALSKYEKNDNKNLKTPNNTKKCSINNSNSSRKMNQNKDLNIFIPNSTLYYNNINININELNINSKTSKDKKNNIISSLNNNQKIKCFIKKNDVNLLENRNNPKNKTISSKKLISCNLSGNKSPHNNNNTINNNSKQNIYSITSNNNSNLDYLISSINNNDNNTKRKTFKYKSKNNSNNKKIKHSSKIERILSTEPKDILKFQKQFSFNKRNDKKNKNDIDIKLIKNNKGSKSEKKSKSHTINNEAGKNVLINQKYAKKENKIKKDDNKNKFDINNLDEIFLYKFMEHKYNKKKNYK